jgi:hypothetical protein
VNAGGAGVVAVGRRISWGLVDQVLSSATNFALTVFVARAAAGADFGAFAIVIATYLVAAGLGQGLAGQPFAARHSAAAEGSIGGAVAGATGAALLLGVVLGIGCVAAGAGAHGALGAQLVVLGLAVPGLLLQDAWRFVFVALGRPARAAANDALWAAVQGAGFAALVVTGHATPIALVATWAIAGCVAAAAGCAQASQLPSLRAARGWVRSERGVAGGFMAQALVIRGAAQLLTTAIALIAGLGAAGAVRGAQVVFSPLTLMYQGLLLAAVPESVRALRSSASAFSRFTRLTAVAATAPAIAWCLFALLAPDRLGRELLGATWQGARPLLPLLAIQVTAIAVSLGAQVGLRALGASGRCLRVDAALAALLLGAGAVGARLDASMGAAIGIAAATAVGAAVWWLALETIDPRPSTPRYPRSPASGGITDV